MCVSWGAPCPPFIGGKGPWVVLDLAPKFGRVPVGFRQPKPTRIRPPLVNPNFTLWKLLAPYGNVDTPIMEPYGLPKIVRYVPDPSGTFHNLPVHSNTFQYLPYMPGTIPDTPGTIPDTSGIIRDLSETLRDHPRHSRNPSLLYSYSTCIPKCRWTFKFMTLWVRGYADMP